jgi:7-alpha-hydroxysteroid dehydrogenase
MAGRRTFRLGAVSETGETVSTSESQTVGAAAFNLEGRVAIITGAGKGIGAATAVTFAEAGADVLLIARTADDLSRVAGEVRARGRRALELPGDVNDVAVLADAVARAVAELGGLDVVVNNAGGSYSRPFLETSTDQLESSFHFNVSVPFELSRLATPHLLESEGGGAIVNVSSVAGLNVSRGSLVHSLTKAALNQLTRLMAAELAPRVRVNAVLPGAIETDALRWYLSTKAPEVRQTMIAHTAMRRNGTPEDIARAILFLAAPAASWITGKLLEVDGMVVHEFIPSSLPDL